MATIKIKHNRPISKRFYPGHTLFRTKDGGLNTRRIGITGDRIKTDPAYAGARRHASEFGRACKAAKLIRVAFHSLLQGTDKSRLPGSLNREVLLAIKSDEIHPKGMRTLSNGHPEILQGFELNTQYNLPDLFAAACKVQVHIENGLASIHIPSFVSYDQLTPPAAITHFQFVTACGAIQPEENLSATDVQRSEFIPFNKMILPSTVLTVKLLNTEGYINFITLGIEFYRLIGTQMLPVNNGSYNPFSIVKVVKV
jgi:hypothetical protein